MVINEKIKLFDDTYLFGCEFNNKKFIAIVKTDAAGEIISLSTYGGNPIDNSNLTDMFKGVKL